MKTNSLKICSLLIVINLANNANGMMQRPHVNDENSAVPSNFQTVSQVVDNAILWPFNKLENADFETSEASNGEWPQNAPADKRQNYH